MTVLVISAQSIFVCCCPSAHLRSSSCHWYVYGKGKPVIGLVMGWGSARADVHATRRRQSAILNPPTTSSITRLSTPPLLTLLILGPLSYFASHQWINPTIGLTFRETTKSTEPLRVDEDLGCQISGWNVGPYIGYQYEYVVDGQRKGHDPSGVPPSGTEQLP